MSIQTFFTGFKAQQFVDAVHEVGNQYGYINSLNMFNKEFSEQDAILFDRDYTSTTLLPQVKRGERASTTGTERKVDTFSIGLGYFKHSDRLTKADIARFRQSGKLELETLENATAQKMEDIRFQWDQTTEYLQLQALKGVSRTPDGAVLADMYTAFGITQKSVNMQLGTASTDVDAKIAEIKSHIAKNAKIGGAVGPIEMMIDPLMFDKLISHPNVKSAYNYYLNTGMQVNRDDLARYSDWGIMNTFQHRGVSFISYDAEFALPGGTTEKAFADNTGIALPLNKRGMFRSVFGPSQKLSEGNLGQELFIRSYLEERDEAVAFEIESAPLYFNAKPNAVVALTNT